MSRASLADSRFSTLWRDAHVFRIPLKRKFRGVRFREGVLFEGPFGWGEFAPFLDHDDQHAKLWLKAALQMAFAKPGQVSVNCVKTNSIVPECDAEESVKWALLGSCDIAKVKVTGQALLRRQELDRLWAVQKALGVTARLRIDLNGSCTVAQAIEFASDCRNLNVDYFEQPCRTAPECGEVRAKAGVRVALDESIRLSAHHENQVLDSIHENADVAILKPIPLGGAEAAQAIARRLDLECVVSSSLDTSVGLAYVARAAASIAPSQTHGLGTGHLLEFDVTEHPLLPHQGEVHIGLQAPDFTKLELASVGTKGAIADKWHDRMARCWDELAEDPIIDLVPR